MNSYKLKNGEFSGPVCTMWLEGGRDVELTETVTFRDFEGRLWYAPMGEQVNGVSIPRWLWPLFGSPYVGKHRRAGVFHDIHCRWKNQPWQRVHKMFYDIALADGVSELEAKIKYKALMLFGPRW